MNSNIFVDFLQVLGVPHTVSYSSQQYAAMPFQSLFGVSKLLESYKVPTEAVNITDKGELSNLTPPFVTSTDAGLVIVTAISPTEVTYLTEGVSETMPRDRFVDAWRGMVFMAFPTPASREPDYGKHRLVEWIRALRNYGLIIGALLLLAYPFVTNGLYRNWSTILLTLLNVAGLYVTFLLVQKTLRIHTKAGDRICRVLQEGGCDDVLATNASKLFGVFSWSEVGFGYFSVSLLTLLIFPQYTGYLALCNACCLPYTIWSISYQKFFIKKWCTLCVTTQLLLWCLFGCYLGGGWYAQILPIRIELFILLIAYVTTVFALSRVMPHFENKDPQ